jgi:hypothetical protein
MRVASLVCAIVLAIATLACRDDSCLEGNCERPCAGTTYTASPLCQLQVVRPLYVGPVGEAPSDYLLVHGSAAADDIVILTILVDR